MSTHYDYITINTPTGGTSTTYTGTQISVNTPAVSNVTKAEVSFTSSQSLNGYSYPWADGTGTNQITGSNRMRDWEITGSGDVVNFYPYQMSSPFNLSRLTTTIEPQQSGSGNPSPTNIRPITGFTGAKANRVGKNFIVQPYSNDYSVTVQGVTFTKNADGSIKAVGTVTTAGDYTYYTDALSGNGGYKGSFILNGITGGSSATYRFGVRIRNTQTATNRYVFVDSGDSEVITTGENEIINRLYIAFKLNVNVNTTFYPMLRLASESNATYEPYNGNTYSVSWSDSVGTVYGGTLDVVSGQLTVTHQLGEYDGSSDENWTGSNTRFAIIPDGGVNTGSGRMEVLSNEFLYSSSATTVGTIFLNKGDGRVYVYPPVYDSLANFKTWLAANPVQIYYPLATPLTYQLTATQVAMITGNNNIWTNCGTITDAGYKLTSSNNDTLTYLYAPNAGLCTGKMPTTIGLGFTYNYLSFEYYSTQAVDIDVYICGTDAKWYDTTYNRTKYVKWDTFSLPAKTSYTKYTLPTRSISLSDLTEGSGDVNSVYFEIVPTTNSPTYPMRIQHVQFDHNSATTTYVPSQNRCTYSGTSSVTLYKRSAQDSSYANSYYKNLNSTVYNGSFEYITGKVTKTYASITLNSSDLTWAVYNDSSTSRAFRATITNMKSLSHSSYDSVRCFCTHASWTTSSERLGFGKFYYSYGYVYFPDYNSKRFNSVDEFTAWLDLQESRGTPVTILYPLSTPTETTLSTTTIKTLAGQNYFDTSSTAANRLPLTMTILQTSFILPRPLNFAVQREDIYAGQYTTCTGATRADKIGWKYSDMTWSWDGLKQSDVEKLCSLSGECTLTFDDPSGDTIQESFIRSSVVSMRCRNKFENEYWWTGVSCSISFIGSHTD